MNVPDPPAASAGRSAEPSADASSEGAAPDRSTPRTAAAGPSAAAAAEGWFLATVRGVRRVIAAVVGGTLLLIGIVMLVLPGPAMLVIPLGLGVLATEFVWARRWLKRVRKRAEAAMNGMGGFGRSAQSQEPETQTQADPEEPAAQDGEPAEPRP